MSLRVLFVAPRRPWERRSGSEVIIADLLNAILGEGEIDLLPVFCRNGDSDGRVPAASGVTEINLDASLRPRASSTLEAGLRLGIPQQYRYRQPLKSAIVARLPADWRPDLVHVEHLQLVEAGIRLSRDFETPLVYRPHNVEAAKWGQHLKAGLPRPVSFAAGQITRYMLTRELRLVGKADLCLPISERDREVLRQAACDECPVVPPSVDEDRIGSRTYRIDPKPTIGFVGSMEYRPNRHGLRWFLSEIWDGVRHAVPEARLELLSRGAEKEPSVRRSEAVRVLDDQYTPGKLFTRSWVSVVPILDGGGTKIKGVESLMAGCPVVATPEGSAGLVAGASRGTTVCSDSDAFILALSGHLGERPAPADRRLLIDWARQRFGARSVAGKLVGLWKGIVS